MAISAVCKFEFKSNVDKVQKEKQISRTKAVAAVALENGILEETGRTMDKRARKELGQLEPKKENTKKKSTPCEDLEKTDNGKSKIDTGVEVKKNGWVNSCKEAFYTEVTFRVGSSDNLYGVVLRDMSEESTIRVSVLRGWLREKNRSRDIFCKQCNEYIRETHSETKRFCGHGLCPSCRKKNDKKKGEIRDGTRIL